MSKSQQAAEVTVAGVRITHPDRVVFPEQGVTKQDLAEYYDEVAEWILPYVAGRPLTVVRCPQGRGGECFFQKHATDSLPPEVGAVEVQEENGPSDYITIDDRRGLVALAQMGALEFHPWLARNDMLEKPDQMVFDLDPGEGARWALVIEGAREVRERLERAGLESFVRTTGGKGLHVLAPLVRRRGWNEAKRFARAISTAMASDAPDRYVDTASKAKRAGKVYVDYLRNARGATAVCSYSTRARAGAPVATPIEWGELTPRLRPDKYSLDNLRQRLTALGRDPWEGFFQTRQSITKRAMKSVGATAD